MKKDLKQNLSTEQINCIKFYKKHKPFLISYCDKNVGWALISKDLYLEIVNDHLFSNLNHSLSSFSIKTNYYSVFNLF